MAEEKVTNTAYSTEIPNLSDLTHYIGRELGLSNWMTITQEMIDSFARTTDDNQWIHVNPEKSAKYSPYKKTVAHGFLILSLASKFCFETLKIMDIAMGVNYGLDKVRFMNATRVGSLLRARVSLMEFDAFEGGGKYKLKIVFELKGEEKPACVAEFIAQAYSDPHKKQEDAVTNNKTDHSHQKNENNTVLFEKEGDIGIITLNRPERYNAVTDDVVNGITSAINKIRKDDDIRAVVITGAGKGFCAGADMAVFGQITPEEGRAYITKTYLPLMRTLFTLRKPIIGAINGTAAGVGASIALACDFRVMSGNSALLYAFVNIGLGPDGGGSWLLARQVGYSKALQIAVEGKKVGGQECLSLGLTNKLVKDDADLLSTTKAWAHELAKRPTMAVGITKEDMFYAMGHDLYETIAFEADKQVATFGSYDFAEGVSAFLEKRPAKFIGK
ncbi:enoyl-CoA hydratase/isomerase family protein [Arenibacter sp. BSSL-BM3]|uniref:Enoyl-CoA hydratase/isomerase family protein n=1 Tax=Arenibacter arenosicollis TaxID=2762274 RepID=A0ABR7QSJ5_9FLAO|nr:enoyl-CoA hydratase-related protein [Arenibacter arenosicollis]MBC8770044.1 enoyl-CoA hydratase/isomerase family protein [Arenibacter arenosicollis]